MNKTSVSICIFLLLSTINIGICADIPYLTGRVNDNAQVFSEDVRKSLSETLKVYEIKTTNQIVILTIPSLEGESIEDFAYKVFNDWKIGQTDKNNGILIVVVPDEKKMRIEVGYGLESTMTDLLSSRIIRQIMTPRFREGDFDGGITEGTLATITVLEGNDLAETEVMSETDDSSLSSNLSDFDTPDLSIGARILLGAFIFGIIGLFTIIAILTPGVGWFLYLFLIPFWAMFPIVVFGTKGALICFFIYLIGFPATKFYLSTRPWYKKAKKDIKTKGKASIGGFTLASTGSGGSWSSGSSSGGFSGGGGSSGGGGASGGW